MTLRQEAHGSVLVLTMDRPEALNALDPETSDEMVAAWEAFRDDAKLRVAVLTGAGEKSFCTGMDLKRAQDWYARAPKGREIDYWNSRPGLGGITRNLDVGKPVIAAINGHCLGGGLELALACDIRLCSENATFALPETQWGLLPGQGGTQRLPKVVGLGLAMEMILAGEKLDAQRALAAGLVSRVLPLSRLVPTAVEWAGRIADRGPLATKQARASILAGLGMPLNEGLGAEQAYAQPLRAGPENLEALKAFREKRKPKW